MTKRVGWSFVLALTAQSAAACSLLIPQDLTGGIADGSAPTEAGEKASPDGTAAEAAAGDIRDAGDDATVAYWSFDLGCSGWSPLSSNMFVESAATLSGGACRVCPASPGDQSYFGIEAIVPNDVVETTPLTFVVDARAAPDSSAPIQVTATIYEGADHRSASTITAGETYAPVGTTYATRAGSSLFVRAQAARQTDCFIVDEGRLSR
jgi:hypothetical protein